MPRRHHDSLFLRGRCSKLGEYAWYSKNSSEGKYGKVGTKKPNPWGLYDMHGNVMEWTLDQYDPKGYAGLGHDNPWNVANTAVSARRSRRLVDGPGRALRCGARVASDPSWKQQDPQLPKSIWYHTDAQGLGFRLVRPVKVPTGGPEVEILEQRCARRAVIAY